MSQPFFDGDAFVAAMRRPSLQVGGTRYTGKLISFQQAIDFQTRMQAVETGTEAQVQLIQEFCQAIDIPVEALFKLPPGGVLAALQHFFACLLDGTPAEPSSPESAPPPRS